jgi:hypothetical protein
VAPDEAETLRSLKRLDNAAQWVRTENLIAPLILHVVPELHALLPEPFDLRLQVIDRQDKPTAHHVPILGTRAKWCGQAAESLQINGNGPDDPRLCDSASDAVMPKRLRKGL